MSSFNEFIELELPRRPFTLEDGAEGQVLVRSDNPERARELVWADFSDVHDHDDRYPVLDGDNLIPKHYIPQEFKQSKVVDNISERDNLSDVYEGLRVHVLDATDDETVGSGGAGYIYHDGTWYKIYEEESLDIDLSWDEIKNKPELYNKTETDALLDEKLAKDANLSDIDNRQIALDNLTNATSESTDKVLSVDNDGKAIWRTIDKYTKSEVDSKLDEKADTSYVQDTYLAKDSNLDDITDRQDALNNITDSESASEDQVLSVDAEGNSVWRTIDKYTKSEVDSKLDEKADSSYVQGTYLAKDSNLDDVTNRQTALDNLTNVSTASQGKVLSVDAEGKTAWREIDKYTQAQVDSKLDEKSDTTHDHDDRYPVLDENDLIPSEHIPPEFRESLIVVNITERDNISDKHDSLRVHVLDATDDPTVEDGGAGYIYYEENSEWIKIYEDAALDLVINWDDVEGKPELYTKSETDSLLDDKADVSYVQDTYLAKSQNLEDLDNRLAAVSYLLNTDSGDENDVLSLDTNGEISWRVIDKYTKSEVDSKLDEKADSSYVQGTYLAKDSNLHDVTDRQDALNNLTDSESASEDQVLSVSANGNSVWRTIDKYTKSEVDGKLDEKADTSYVQDTYLAKDSNLSDVDSRQTALNNITDSTNATKDEVLSVDSNGNSVWREIDKYTKSEVDGKLDEKADTSYVQDTYLAKDSNLSDVTNRQTALDNLTNVSTASQGKVLSVDTEGKTAWREIDKYTQAQVDSKLDEKADSSYVQGTYLAKDSNLDDVTNRQTSLNNLTDSTNANTNEVLSVDSNGNSIWREIDKYTKSEVDGKLDEKADDDHEHSWGEINDKPELYTKSETDSLLDDKADVSYVQDTYLAKDQNLHDLENRTDALNYLVNAGTDKTDKVLSVDSQGKTTWRTLDKYTKSEVDSKLDEKADDNHEHSWGEINDKPELYTKSETDSLLDDKSDVGHTHVEEDITDLDKYTKDEVDSKVNEVKGKLLTEEFIVQIGAGETAEERINHEDTLLPDGWKLFAADDSEADLAENFQSSPDDLVIQHNTDYHFVADLQYIEHRRGGAPTNQGFTKIAWENAISIPWKHALDYENYKQIGLRDIMSMVNSPSTFMVFIRLAYLPGKK